MLDLEAFYQQLAAPWSREQLAAHYRDANRRGEQLREGRRDAAIRGPTAMLATSIPQSASLNVAVHVLHLLPSTADELAGQLIVTINDDAAAALHACHRALELDGQAHQYTAAEWLPTVYDIAGPLLKQARLHREPPSIVESAQQAVRWLAGAIINLDQDAPDTPAAIADGMGHLLAVRVFGDAAGSRLHSLDDELV
jgi:hypothetical protein